MHGIEDFNGQRFAAVRYIGKQPRHRDTVLNRPNLLWNGQGDVQWVPEVDAAVYIRFTDIWELAADVVLPAGGLLPQLARAGAPSVGFTDPKATLGRTPLVPQSLQTPAQYQTDAKCETPLSSEVLGDYAKIEKVTAELASKRILQVVEALGKLKPSDFATGSGIPNCKSLSKILGREVLSTERDAAWAIVRKQMQAIADQRVTELGEGAVAAAEGEGTTQVEGGTDGTDAPADPADAIPEV